MICAKLLVALLVISLVSVLSQVDVAILIPANVAFAQTPIIMEGHIRTVDAYAPVPGDHSYSHFFFPEDSETAFLLNFENTNADWSEIKGKQVKIMGFQPDVSASGSVDIPFYVTEISPVDSPDGVAAFDTQQSVPSSVKSITLLSKFADVSAEPHNVQYFQDRFYDDSDSLRQFYLTSSYGQFSWTGSVSDWKTVSKNQLAYRSGGLPNFDLLIIDAIALHDPTVDFSGVTSLILVFNGILDPSGSAWGSIGTWYTFQTNEGPISVSVTWEYDEGTWFPVGEDIDAGIGVTAHELGHNVEFDHTPAPPGSWLGGYITDPYHDPWSVMSSNYDRDGPSALIMGQRDQVGWVASNDKVTIPRGTSSIVTLDYINQPASGPNPHMAIVPLPSGNSYIIEAHTDEIFNDTPNDGEGIMMYNFFPRGNQYPYLTFGGGYDKPAKYGLVGTSGTNFESDFAYANLDVGETYTDSNNVTVLTQSKTATSVTVAISNNGPSIIPPTLTTVSITSNNTRQTVAGDPVTLTFTADTEIQAVAVTIDGNSSTAINTSGNTWTATRIMQVGDTIGTVAFTIDFENLTATAGLKVTATTDYSSVQFIVDITPPWLSAVSITSNNTNPIQAVAGDLVTLTFTAVEPIQNVTATISDGIATVTDTGGNTFTATRTMQAGDPVGQVAFTIYFEDRAGNAGTQVTYPTDESSVISTGSTTDEFYLTPWGDTVNVTDCLNSSLCSRAGQGQLAVSGNNVYVLFNAEAPCNNEPIFCDGGGTDDYEILIASSTDGGQTFGSPINISNSLFRSDTYGRGSYSTTDAQIAAFGNNVIGVWSERDAMSDIGIFARISTDAGASFGTRITIQDFGGAQPNQPIVAASSSGFFLAYEESKILPGIIFCNSSFSESFNCQRLAGSLEDDCDFFDTIPFCTDPKITTSGENVYVTWHTSFFRSLDIGNLMIRVSNDGGSFFNPKINLSDFVTIDNYIDYYSITADGDNVYVVWDDGISSNISFIASNNAGSSFGSSISLAPGTYGWYPVVAASGNNVYVTYETNSGIGEFRRSTDSGANFDPPIQIGYEISSGSGWVGTAGERVFVVYGNGVYQSSIDNGVSFGPINPSPQLIGIVEGMNPVVVSDGNKIYILDDTGAFRGPTALREVILDVGDVSAAGPPSPPVITSPTDGAIITDSDSYVTITGTAGPTATVELFDGQTSIITNRAYNGNWSHQEWLDDGIHSFTAIATDAVGNVSAASTAVNITVGTSTFTAWTQAVLDLRLSKSQTFQDAFPIDTNESINRLLAWAGNPVAQTNNPDLQEFGHLYSIMKRWNERVDLQNVFPGVNLAADPVSLVIWSGRANVLANPFNSDLQAHEPTFVLLRYFFLERDDLRTNPAFVGALDASDPSRLYCFAANSGDTRLTPHKTFYENNCATTQSAPTFSFGGTLESAKPQHNIMTSGPSMSTEETQYSMGIRSMGNYLTETNSGKICGLSLCSDSMTIEEKILLYLEAIKPTN